ncbi:TylF/MycF/NovP-related O-methyltransferase [Parvibaculum sp.]|uniref:TylF/MycF/NovP-related O-methyltransferase n=1 Tax=Parvibaculum sp. TaxID=2024848 RepID=UPI0034A02A94
MLAELRTRLSETWTRRQLSQTARDVRDAHLTYLTPTKLRNLEDALERIGTDCIEGDCVEYGVALGGSAILIATRMTPDRCFTGFDLFGTIPPPGEADGEKSHERYKIIASGHSKGIGGDRYYGYEPDLYGKVKAQFARFGVPVDGQRIALVKGLFDATVSFKLEKRIAFAHIDCDWHDAVALCLERTWPHLSRGGIVILDDYNDYGGCRKATTAFLERRPDMRLVEATHNAILVKS